MTEPFLHNQKCGICGAEAELGPYAGGPYAYYCKKCHFMYGKIIRDYLHFIELVGFSVQKKRRRKKPNQTKLLEAIEK